MQEILEFIELKETIMGLRRLGVMFHHAKERDWEIEVNISKRKLEDSKKECLSRALEIAEKVMPAVDERIKSVVTGETSIPALSKMYNTLREEEKKELSSLIITKQKYLVVSLDKTILEMFHNTEATVIEAVLKKYGLQFEWSKPSLGPYFSKSETYPEIFDDNNLWIPEHADYTSRKHRGEVKSYIEGIGYHTEHTDRVVLIIKYHAYRDPYTKWGFSDSRDFLFFPDEKKLVKITANNEEKMKKKIEEYMFETIPKSFVFTADEIFAGEYTAKFSGNSISLYKNGEILCNKTGGKITMYGNEMICECSESGLMTVRRNGETMYAFWEKGEVYFGAKARMRLIKSRINKFQEPSKKLEI